MGSQVSWVEAKQLVCFPALGAFGPPVGIKEVWDHRWECFAGLFSLAKCRFRWGKRNCLGLGQLLSLRAMMGEQARRL